MVVLTRMPQGTPTAELRKLVGDALGRIKACLASLRITDPKRGEEFEAFAYYLEEGDH